jgi:PKD repeat protein
LRSQSLFVTVILLAAVVGSISAGAYASDNVLQAGTSVSFTFTTTSNYQVTSGGNLQVMFNSIQLTGSPPQAYSFGVAAKTSPGLSITRILWQFGDGVGMDLPYCCQSQVSEVQYHAYAQPGTYTVVVVVFDNGGNFGNAIVTVNWTAPVPEFPAYGLPLLASLLTAFLGINRIRKKSGR